MLPTLHSAQGMLECFQISLWYNTKHVTVQEYKIKHFPLL
jgi:hypothetical protein